MSKRESEGGFRGRPNRFVRRSARWATALVVVMLVWVGLGSSVWSTTMIYRSVDELAEMSDRVVRGTVLDHHTFWSDDGQMYTDWSLQIEEVLSGAPVSALTVRQMGGELDGYAIHIPGDASLEDGEHVVVFLREIDGIHYLTALGQSKLSVSLQGDLGIPNDPIEYEQPGISRIDATLVRDLTGIAFFRPSEDGGDLYGLGNEILTLSELRDRVAESNEGGVR